MNSYFSLRWIGLMLCLIGGSLAAQPVTQVVRGTLTQAATGQPVAEATVSVLGPADPMTAVSDSEGRFRLAAVPVGRHTIQVRKEGYAAYTISDLVVGSGKEVVLEVALEEVLYEAGAVEITGNSSRDLRRVSTRVFTVEEAKRFAAVYFDPARLAASFPGVIQANDQANNLVVRGNSPNGVAWRMEGVDIVNPNHLTNAGTFSDRLSQSGGGTIILSTQLLANSSFSTGAFAPEYGNALAGVFDIHLRRGNNERYEFTGQAGLIGVDLAAEGPLGRKQGGSFLANYRYSTVGLLGLMGISFGGEEITYQDLAFNLSLPTRKAGTFTLFGMGGTSLTLYSGPQEDSLRQEAKDRYDIDFRSRMGAMGVTHRIALGTNTSLRSVLAVSGIESTRFGDIITDTGALRRVEEDTLVQTRVSFHTALRHRFSARSQLTVGTYLNQLGYRLGASRRHPFEPAAALQPLNHADGSYFLLQPYANWHYQLGSNLGLDAGLHSMYFFLNGSRSLEPRLSLNWQMFRRHSLRLAYGLHSQLQAPGTYFATVAGPSGQVTTPNTDLGFTRAHHMVLGYHALLAENLHLRLEPYFQYLFGVPVVPDPFRPVSVLNLQEGYVTDSLVAEGRGRNMGIDFSLERYLSNNYYFLLSGSLYDSKYTAADGVSRDTRFNGNYLFSLTAGREFERVTKRGKNKVFGVNLRGIYQGGFRAMPILLDASQQAFTTVFDDSQGFTERFPDYFRADLRVVFKRFAPKYTRTFSLDIQNVLNTQNVAFETYDFVAGGIVTRYQLGLIPLMSYRIEF
ncbi:MAG: TonB-dependent receptor [Bacteroidetes bacterium]|nr:MAG: TonB-dependent receptor [Bacteroidota bacterium]